MFVRGAGRSAVATTLVFCRGARTLRPPGRSRHGLRHVFSRLQPNPSRSVFTHIMVYCISKPQPDPLPRSDV